METIWKSVLELSYVGIWVILTVMVIRCLFFKIPKKFSYILWLIPGIRLLIPVSFTGIWELVRNAAKINSVPLVSQSLPVERDTMMIREQIESFVVIEHSSVEVVKGESVPSVMNILSIVWLAGVVLLMGYGIFSYIRLKRKLKISIKWKENIYLADEILTPFVLPGFSDRIYLPSEIKKEDYHYILLHEQYHIKRKDSLFKLIAYIILCVYWFNPIVWLGFYFFNRDMEMSCDEAVTASLTTEECREYAKDLLRFSVSRRQWLQFPVAFGERGVRGRIMNIFRKKAKSKLAFTIAGICVIAAGVILIPNFKNFKGQKVVKEEASEKEDVDYQEQQNANESGENTGTPSGGEEKIYSLDENEKESGLPTTTYVVKKMKTTINGVPAELEWKENQYTVEEIKELADKVYKGFFETYQSESVRADQRYRVDKIIYSYDISHDIKRISSHEFSSKRKKMIWKLEITLPEDWRNDTGMGMLCDKKRKQEMICALAKNERGEWEFLDGAWRTYFDSEGNPLYQ